MKTRLERILKKLAQKHLPHLLNNMPANIDDRLRWLADGLAKEGILVIVGGIPDVQYQERVSQWVGGYADLVMLIAKQIFPSSAGVDAVFADNNQPPIVVLDGRPAAVMQQLGSYVAPFLAMYNDSNQVTDIELRGVMQSILDELEAGDLPPRQYTFIWQEGMKILRWMLELDMTHYAVTTPAPELMRKFAEGQLLQLPNVPQFNPEVHEKPKPPLPPEMLPEEPPPIEETDSAELFKDDIPLFPSVQRNKTDKKRRTLPVMLPPELRDKDE